MKFYEFDDCEYYALIGAETEEKAIEFYKEVVADIDEDDGVPSELTEEEVKIKIMVVCEEDKREGSLKKFDKYTREDNPYLILIDGNLA